jgi:hypothetical protein
MARNDLQKPVPRVHSCEGIWEGREDGSVGRLSFSFTEFGVVPPFEGKVTSDWEIDHVVDDREEDGVGCSYRYMLREGTARKKKGRLQWDESKSCFRERPPKKFCQLLLYIPNS